MRRTTCKQQNLSHIFYILIGSSYNIDEWTWEPARESSPTPDEPASGRSSPTSPTQALSGRKAVEDALRQRVYVHSFPSRHAGAPIDIHGETGNTRHASGLENSRNNPYAPFNDRFNWEIARWAKLRGPGSNALNELLAIEGVCVWLFFLNSNYSYWAVT